jgi:general secretion pathway protein G
MQMIKKAVMMFRNDVKRLPTEEEGIVVLWDKSALDEEVAARWQGPYLEEAIPNDIWGRELKYLPTEDSSFGFDLISVGPDGEEGTADDITLAKLGAADGDVGGSSGGTP